MERVAFLLENTGERLGCLLNPDHVLLQRTAGVRARRSLGGPFTGAGQVDDPLLFIGGGTTELTLELLFDVSIAGSTLKTGDVRDLTRPLWQLAERAESFDGRLKAPQVRFVWGKAWNVPGVVVTIAERLERFTAGGAPQRSWLRMKLLRVSEVMAQAGDASLHTARPMAIPTSSGGFEEQRVHQVIGGGSADDGAERGSGQRLDELAYLYYGDATLWRQLAEANDIEDPFNIGAGTVVRIPPRSG